MATRTVGIIGTFDVENYGDLLFPFLAEHELRGRLGDVAVRRYSYHRKDAGSWPYEVRSTLDLLADLDDLDGLVVGGGHLVRFDRDVAPGYRPAAADLHHPTSIWLTPVLAAAAAGVPVAWNAVGASTDTPSWALPWLRAAVMASSYVSVRDPSSAAELRTAAPGAPVGVVPDTAFGLAGLMGDADHGVGELLARLGVDRPFVVVQAAPRLRGAQAQLSASLPRLTAAGLAVLELPVSPALGDRPGLLGVDFGQVPVEPWPHPLTLAALVGRAAGVVAHSLHLSITALALGVPLHRLPIPAGSKYALLQAFPGVQTFASAGTELADHVLGADRASDTAEMAAARADVTSHWDRLAAAIAPGAATSARSLAARRLPLTVPGALEELVADNRRVAAERDEVRDAEQALARGLDEERAWARGLAVQARAVADELADRELEVHHVRVRLRAVEAELADLRAEPVVRLALQARGRAAETVRSVRRLRRGAVRPGPVPSREATAQEEAELAARLRAELPSTGVRGGPLVSIVLLNRSGAHHLRRCMPALEATAYADLELVVVDNGSDDDSVAYLERRSPRFPVRILRNAGNRSFSAATNQGVAAARGELLLLLNNDIEPLTPDWLGRLVETLQERRAAAVGARLIYPRRPRTSGVRVAFDDLTLQHRGVGFRLEEGMPRGVNLGAGEDPCSSAAAAVHEAEAVTAACLLVRRDVYEAVRGLDEAYDYGMEDVDLCLRLRQRGDRVIYDGGVALWHHEFGTQGQETRAARLARWDSNYEHFLDGWGPQVAREVLVDRLTGARRWSEEPLHVAITVTRDDPEAGWGDWFTAHELGDELERLGWRVTYVEQHRDRWYRLPRDVDIVVALLDSYDLRRVPPHVLRVAWVRNWTNRWLDRPWFGDYDIVLASSARSRELVEQRSGKAAHLLPLATNPSRFRPSVTPAPDTDVLFAGSYWNKPRRVISALPRLPAEVRVRVYGRGWEKVPAVSALHRGFLRYDQLPQAYARTRVVLDDTASHTMPYGAVNSRVFDALAAGALVLTDNHLGIRELFDEDFPVYRTSAELPAKVAALLADPEQAADLVARYRRVVLEHHTYEVRAHQLRDILLGWARGERVDLTVGAAGHTRAATADDHHLARGLQRALERSGRPARVLLAPAWTARTAARSDVVVHVAGRRVPRSRPSQVNVLWAVSHPELLTPERCTAHDLVLVASDQIAARLRSVVPVPVDVLHRACDLGVARPVTAGPGAQLLFAGDAGTPQTRILHDLVPTDRDLGVHGRGWTPALLDPKHLRGGPLPVDSLRAAAAAADLVLIGDPGQGFLSTALYEALAAGAAVVARHHDGLASMFDGAVATYTTGEDLTRLVNRLLDDPGERRWRGRSGQVAVLERHTFVQRAAELLELLEPLLAARDPWVRGDLQVLAAPLAPRPDVRAPIAP